MANQAISLSSSPNIKSGVCHLFFVYDVAQGIDLARCAKQIGAITQELKIRHKRRAPHYFEFNPPPLRLTQEIAPLAAGDFPSTSGCEFTIYDFGAISVTYRIPLTGAFSTLMTLGQALEDTDAFLNDSRNRVASLLTAIRESVARPVLAPQVEDYICYHVHEFSSPIGVEELVSANAQSIARTLRAEKEPLSAQEAAEVAGRCISFGPDDISVIDWDGALLIGTGMDDVLAVLEFANVELLEMRFLDRQLDGALDESYDALAAGKGNSWLLPGSRSASLARIARYQIDGAILYERVHNALKLFGDQYLARVYRLASESLHLAEWNGSILRKLDVIRSIYERMNDQAATRRMEVLEWIIIVLIAVSILIPFLPDGWGH